MSATMNRYAKVLILISFFFLSFTSNLNLVDAGDAASASVILNAGNFEQLVMQSKDVWFVLFAAPWCGYARQLKPEWDKAAKNLEGKVKFGELDCDVENDLQARFEVTGFPTIIAFGPDKCQKGTILGERTAEALEKAGNDYYNRAKQCKEL